MNNVGSRCSSCRMEVVRRGEKKNLIWKFNKLILVYEFYPFDFNRIELAATAIVQIDRVSLSNNGKKNRCTVVSSLHRGSAQIALFTWIVSRKLPSMANRKILLQTSKFRRLRRKMCVTIWLYSMDNNALPSNTAQSKHTLISQHRPVPFSAWNQCRETETVNVSGVGIFSPICRNQKRYECKYLLNQ